MDQVKRVLIHMVETFCKSGSILKSWECGVRGSTALMSDWLFWSHNHTILSAENR